jgi:hypothetical protein
VGATDYGDVHSGNHSRDDALDVEPEVRERRVRQPLNCSRSPDIDTLTGVEPEVSDLLLLVLEGCERCFQVRLSIRAP